MPYKKLRDYAYDKSVSNSDLFLAFTDFKTYYDGLCTVFLRSITYTNKQLAEEIFKKSWNQKQEIQIIKKHTYAAKKTLERFHTFIDVNNIDKYRFILFVFCFDVYEIIRYIEVEINKNPWNINLGSRPDQSPREIFDVARMLPHLNKLDASKIHLREVLPVSIFLIRQTIEVYGKQLLGFHSITDAQGNRSKSIGTQVAWEYVAYDQKNHKRITLPVDLDTILKVEKWTNAYVHTGIIQELYLIENALHFIEPLIFPVNKNSNHEGKIYFAATSTIVNYNALKVDFENYINSNSKTGLVSCILKIFRKKKKRNMKIHWIDENNMTATVISL